MNNIFKTALKLKGLKALINPVKNVTFVSAGSQQRQFARSLWYMCNSRNGSTHKKIDHSDLCSCGCGETKRTAHTKREKELVEFLTEEILEERKAQKVKTIPSELEGFNASLNGAEVILTKRTNDETIKISFNVNHSVDTDMEPEINEKLDKPDIGELKSKPAFKVDLVRGNTTISLFCSFINTQDEEEPYTDIFGIDEISIYDGEWNESVYSVSGEVVDSYLHDLIMNYLEEKGISNEFVEKLSNYSTLYEHSAYISLLEGMSKFVSGK